jgi:hypothetical protein
MQEKEKATYGIQENMQDTKIDLPSILPNLYGLECMKITGKWDGFPLG